MYENSSSNNCSTVSMRGRNDVQLKRSVREKSIKSLGKVYRLDTALLLNLSAVVFFYPK